MKFGYARVSTTAQAEGGISLDEQVDTLTAAGVDERHLFIERGVSGKLASRPQLDTLLGKLRPGDEVIVTRLDRLGRSNAHLSQLVERFNDEGVTVRSIRDGVSNDGAFGTFMLSMLSSLAQLERERISERTREGLAKAAQQGRHGGRPEVTPEDKRVQRARELRTKGLTVPEVASSLGVSRHTVYRWLKVAETPTR